MAIRKRKIQITGYLVAMVVWLVGMMFALAYVGMHDGFVGWVFLAPFGFVGLVLYGFGKWADSVSKRPPPGRPAAASAPSTVATPAATPNAEPAPEPTAEP